MVSLWSSASADFGHGTHVKKRALLSKPEGLGGTGGPRKAGFKLRRHRSKQEGGSHLSRGLLELNGAPRGWRGKTREELRASR